jgi:hypothetical protein
MRGMPWDGIAVLNARTGYLFAKQNGGCGAALNTFGRGIP